VGEPASLDLDSHHFQWFYAAFVGLTVAAVSIVSLPDLPLIPLIYSSQVVNAVVLPLHVVALQLLSSDGALMGEARSTSWVRAGGWISIALIVACVGALGWSQLP
jgi:Mn2+/Fe2+ NRAMP family transporter